MTIDDTPHRIIIHDLSREIAQIEADEAAQNATLFLADIDKRVSGLPHHLLQAQNHDRHLPPAPENLNTALILYKDPSSISIPEEEDVVRKTIIEARRRVREKTAEEQREMERERQEREAHDIIQHPRVGLEDAMMDQFFHGTSEADMDDYVDAMDIE